MSNGGTQHFPWLHPDMMPIPLQGCSTKNRPLGREASPQCPMARTAVSLVPGGAPGL